MDKVTKFRVWEIKEKRFVDYYSILFEDNIIKVHVAIGDQYYLINNTKASEEYKRYLISKNIEIKDDFILCDYTGLLDKNGKECYYKDILKSGNKLFIIEWQHEEARFWLAPIKNSSTWRFMDEVNRMENVGSYYQMPHLLRN